MDAVCYPVSRSENGFIWKACRQKLGAEKMDMTLLTSIVEQKRAVIFDLFHTLTAIESSSGSGLPLTCDMLGVSRDAWHDQLQLHSRSRLTGQQKDPFRIISQMARAIDPAIPDETIHAAIANRIKRFEAALLDIPDETKAVLQTLKARGKRLGLISNADAMEVAAWNSSPLAESFDTAILSCSVGVVKPEKEIYDICLEHLDVRHSEALYVGDGGSRELQGAQAVGLTTVMMVGIIKDIWPDKVEERRLHADFTIEHLSELVDDQKKPNQRIQPAQ